MALLLMLMFFTGAGLILSLCSSVFLGVSQLNFFNSWVCLEVNMLMFLALMGVWEKSTPSASMKYFIVQSIGSSVFLWAIGLESGGLGILSSSVVGSALSLKLGIAPFQSWFVSVLSSLGWELVFLASTLQKILPVYLLSALKSEILGLFASFSVIISVLGSMNQTFLKKILAYSSIFMTIWLLICEGELAKSMEYLAAYGNALGVVTLLVATLAVEEMGEVLASLSMSGTGLLMSGFLSMGGCPPFIGFYAKVTVILSMLLHSQWVIMSVLVLASVFLLYVYMRLFYSGLSFANSPKLTAGVSRASASLCLLLSGLLLFPGFLCLGVTHSKFWTFSI